MGSFIIPLPPLLTEIWEDTESSALVHGKFYFGKVGACLFSLLYSVL